MAPSLPDQNRAELAKDRHLRSESSGIQQHYGPLPNPLPLRFANPIQHLFRAICLMYEANFMAPAEEWRELLGPETLAPNIRNSRGAWEGAKPSSPATDANLLCLHYHSLVNRSQKSWRRRGHVC